MTTLIRAPLVGFRAWRVDANLRLRPMAHYSALAWQDATDATAECRHVNWSTGERGEPTDHEAPKWSCSCGLHGYYQPTHRQTGIRGAIIAWGRIIEHETGFRAQYARIIALEDGPDAQGVADRYMLPMLPNEELAQYAGWFGEIRDP